LKKMGDMRRENEDSRNVGNVEVGLKRLLMFGLNYESDGKMMLEPYECGHDDQIQTDKCESQSLGNLPLGEIRKTAAEDKGNFRYPGRTSFVQGSNLPIRVEPLSSS